jgi:hypothetical protein
MDRHELVPISLKRRGLNRGTMKAYICNMNRYLYVPCATMPATLIIAALHLLQFLATIPTLFSQDMAMPNCTPVCGNISIPYPFGIGDEGCYGDEGFKLVCNMEQDPPMLYMNSAGYPVVHIS